MEASHGGVLSLRLNHSADHRRPKVFPSVHFRADTRRKIMFDDDEHVYSRCFASFRVGSDAAVWQFPAAARISRLATLSSDEHADEETARRKQRRNQRKKQ